MTDFVNRIADIIAEYGEAAEPNMQKNMAFWVSSMDTHTEGDEAE